jgi:hypothetical protein
MFGFLYLIQAVFIMLSSMYPLNLDYGTNEMRLYGDTDTPLSISLSDYEMDNETTVTGRISWGDGTFSLINDSDMLNNSVYYHYYLLSGLYRLNITFYRDGNQIDSMEYELRIINAHPGYHIEYGNDIWFVFFHLPLIFILFLITKMDNNRFKV